jgi:hypothetical protein
MATAEEVLQLLKSEVEGVGLIKRRSLAVRTRDSLEVGAGGRGKNKLIGTGMPGTGAMV